MKTILIAIAMAFAITGCSQLVTPADPGYQFGDTTRSLLQLQDQYCATADPRQRALILAVLEKASVPIPDRGACTDIAAVLEGRELDAFDSIDLEAAEADRQRALERLEGGAE